MSEVASPINPARYPTTDLPQPKTAVASFGLGTWPWVVVALVWLVEIPAGAQVPVASDCSVVTSARFQSKQQPFSIAVSPPACGLRYIPDSEINRSGISPGAGAELWYHSLPGMPLDQSPVKLVISWELSDRPLSEAAARIDANNKTPSAKAVLEAVGGVAKTEPFRSTTVAGVPGLTNSVLSTMDLGPATMRARSRTTVFKRGTTLYLVSLTNVEALETQNPMVLVLAEGYVRIAARRDEFQRLYQNLLSTFRFTN